MTSDKFLGYLVSHRGTETNPDKVKAIQGMSSPRSIRDVQRLTGRLAALNRFLSQSAARALPFFKVLKKADMFSWTEECQRVFEQMKEYLHQLPTLTSPRVGETLYLYVSAGEKAVSAVLIWDDSFQVPIYYVSRALRGLKTYKPGPKSSCVGESSGAGLLFEDPHGDAYSYALRFDFAASNNEAEYEAVIVFGEYETREESMQRYLSKVHQLAAYFKSFERQKILRSQNRRADALSRLASTSFSALNKTVLVKVLAEPGYMEDQVYPVASGDTWMTPLIKFLDQGLFPDDKAEARKMQQTVARYTIRDGRLYKQSYLGPWLRCITPKEGERTLKEIYEGLCRVHVGYRDAGQENPASQLFLANFKTRRPTLGTLLPFLSASYSGAPPPNQFYDPHHFILAFRAMGNRYHWTFLSGGRRLYPYSCGHRLLHEVDELPSVLWSYRTTPRSATRETPFFLTYGSEAVVPAEFITPSPRMAAFTAKVNDEERKIDLDLTDEIRDASAARIALHKNILANYYNAQVKYFRFRLEDLVLRKNSISRSEPQGKLNPRWEGPYRVVDANQSGYCKLAYRDGPLVPRTWHAENLRLYYS
ncbi:uncharacterized protein [Coffea arabica]|uniref:Reverse transcriptase/retrotransposon-derived protein RNase H-like domain-containing protein n=1 Tax=Coffea arabica TaxID=13443 RepID=A0A6P6V2A4_COFAR